MIKKILILCTGNSCRSQMAEGILKSLDRELEVYSAGTKPENEVNKYAVAVMKELGIDISSQFPENVDKYTDYDFDYVITVCDNAKEVCPVFTGNVKNRLHIGFEDPAAYKGNYEDTMNKYRLIRDEIKKEFEEFYNKLHVN